MNAGALASAHSESQQIRPSTRAGYTTISTGTLAQLVTAVAAEAFNVPRDQVRASLRDDQGQLSVSLVVGLTLQLPPTSGGTVFERAAAAREKVARRIHELAGTTVRRVDVRYTDLHGDDHKKVGRVQ